MSLSHLLKKIRGHNAIVPLVGLTFIGFLLLIIFISINYASFLNELEQIINKEELESQKMRINSELMEIARARTRITAQIIDTKDFFGQDELNVQLEILANNFVNLRNDFLQLELTADEKQRLLKHKEIVELILPKQREAVTLAMSNNETDKAAASKVLYDIVLPGQGELIKSFGEMVVAEQQRIAKLTVQAKIAMRKMQQRHYSIAASTVSIMFVFSIIIIIRIRRIQRDLIKSHFSLEKTVEARTKELTRTQRILKSVLNNIPVRVYWKDRHSQYIGGNKLFLKDAKIESNADLVGKSDENMPWKAKASEYKKQDLELIQKNTSIINTVEEVESTSGKKVWLESSHVPLLDESDKCIGVLGTYQNITERIQGEENLKEAMKSAEMANIAKSNFLANMSHEIRTPMNGIIGLSYLALKDDLNETQREYIENVHKSAEHLLTIINDILDFSKIEANQLQLESIPFNIKELMSSIEYLVKVRINEKALKLNINFDASVPDVLLGDSVRVNQILINLINNAIKFTENGSISVDLKCTDVNTKTAELNIAVSDTGIGIRREIVETLFSPFHQADASTTRKYGGTGLGLSICKRLCEMMHGSISVESELGKGSQFIVKLLMDIPDTEQLENVFSISKSTEVIDNNKALSGAKILLVEDNKINQQVITGLFKNKAKDIFIRVAGDGVQALKMLNEETYDLILMDCQMPVMDGYDTTRRIRDERRFDDMPVIALTANAMKGDIEKALQAGMNDHIAKPVDVDILFAVLHKWIGKKNIIDKYTDSSAESITGQQEPEDKKTDWSDFYELDAKNAIFRINNNEALYAEVLKTYALTQSDFTEIFYTALETGDMNLAERKAHSLKGASATIGAMEIYELANTLEMAVRSEENIESIKKRVAPLEKLQNALCEKIVTKFKL